VAGNNSKFAAFSASDHPRVLVKISFNELATILNWSRENHMNEIFRKFAQATSNTVGSFWPFLIAFVVVVVWGVTGPMYQYSDTWQLVMNTVSSVITFLMVFLIQNTQNRDAKAIQLKLNELLCGVAGARTGLVNLEALSDEDLLRLHREFERLGQREVPLKPPAEPKT
jgi:low affinity Fe/Cu permease